MDRIITAEHARGRGLARALYLDLFAETLGMGHDRVVDAFHTALGFVEVGRAVINAGGKTVRYYERAILSPAS